ncbi:MAG: phosphate ABC transporter permease PstA [Chloroflexi bacterium]|nr:phosphate ABC transporter permease PstA [Chloroflexota bacterium]
MAFHSLSSTRKTYRLARDNVFAALFAGSVVIGVLVLAWLLIEVFIDSIGWLDWQFLSSYSSRHPDESGILAPIAGTFWEIILTAIKTVPVGIATAIYLEEFAPANRITRLIQLNISNLAGVPSVVYGLLGLAIFVQYLFDGQRSLVAGALTLSLLVMPIVIIASQEAIRAVPPSYRDAAYAMGATRWQVVKMVVLPQAIPSIMSGIILAMSRAIGETAPILVVSSLVFITYVPTSPFDRFTVLPLQIVTWVSQPQDDFRHIAAAAIVILLVMLLTMNAAAIYIRAKFQRRAEY